ncbi:MAG TPA: hypothetical protein VIP77_24165 [Jiangellaceae bacterium]
MYEITATTAQDVSQQVATTERTASGARRRTDGSVVGQLNLEWARLRVEPTAERAVLRWAEQAEALHGCRSLADIEARTAASSRPVADQILLALLELTAAGERLAGRTVLQLMLGKAVRIAAAQSGRAERDLLEQLAVSALWDVIATYPITRRREKVAANLSMDTLRQVVAELAPDRQETPAEPESFGAGGSLMSELTGEASDGTGTVPDLELLDVLVWGVDQGVLSRDEAALLVRVYCPAPGSTGGAEAAAAFGLSWPAARQRCSRAVRRLAAAIREDVLEGHAG